MKNVLVICRDYKSVKREMNKWIGRLPDKVKLTEQTIEFADYRFIFRTYDDKEKVMGLAVNGFWVDEPAELPDEMRALLHNTIRGK